MFRILYVLKFFKKNFQKETVFVTFIPGNKLLTTNPLKVTL